jgi:predicted DNA-binding transcriptional regulator AlpA
MTTTTTNDRFLTVPQIIERWPLGRTRVYQLIKSPEFPKAPAAPPAPITTAA